MLLFHHPMSASSRFIRLVLAEYGENTELQEEQPWQRRPEFLQLNPAGTLPVLIGEAGVAIIGAFAISEYLDETRGADDAREAADARFAAGARRSAPADRLVPGQDGNRRDAGADARARPSSCR
jgi:glutathione S-transferase